MTEKGIADKLAITHDTKVALSDVVHVERVGPLPAGVASLMASAMRRWPSPSRDITAALSDLLESTEWQFPAPLPGVWRNTPYPVGTLGSSDNGGKAWE